MIFVSRAALPGDCDVFVSGAGAFGLSSASWEAVLWTGDCIGDKTSGGLEADAFAILALSARRKLSARLSLPRSSRTVSACLATRLRTAGPGVVMAVPIAGDAASSLGDGRADSFNTRRDQAM
jgi:hypothetical protein